MQTPLFYINASGTERKKKWNISMEIMIDTGETLGTLGAGMRAGSPRG